MRYALDANIVIKYLRKDIKVVNKIRSMILDGHDLFIPIVADYEIKRGFYISGSFAKMRAYENLKRECKVIQINDTTWRDAVEVYAELYHKRLTVGEMDMLIAAICLENDCILVTNNITDFENIEGLKLEDWTI
ncbi:MAG: PIN domain-containing protein [Defluviitaleaceae bacterium]|nr:PIN domain-containing protein [Defluviitaleaceae bacterium]